MPPLQSLFDQFLRERRYLQNVTPKTLAWYQAAWLAFRRASGGQLPESLTTAGLQAFVVSLRDRGVAPVTCNTWLRALNAFGAWLHAQGHSPVAIRLRPLRVERRLISILDDPTIRRLLTYKPRTWAEQRVQTLVCTLLDTGCRVDEVLSARVGDFDHDNLLVTVVGKGRKQRRVPFSTELRKRLVRFRQAVDRAELRSDRMFPERDGGVWDQRNALRSYYCLQRRLGQPRSGFHRLRHTFATQYLKQGGDLVRLSLILGHSEVSTTMRYLHLLTEDLQRPHEGLSILTRLR
jgi:integrase/recombinase XerD